MTCEITYSRDVLWSLIERRATAGLRSAAARRCLQHVHQTCPKLEAATAAGAHATSSIFIRTFRHPSPFAPAPPVIISPITLASFSPTEPGKGDLCPNGVFGQWIRGRACHGGIGLDEVQPPDGRR